MSINQQMDKQNKLYSYNEILFRLGEKKYKITNKQLVSKIHKDLLQASNPAHLSPPLCNFLNTVAHHDCFRL